MKSNPCMIDVFYLILHPQILSHMYAYDDKETGGEGERRTFRSPILHDIDPVVIFVTM